MAKTALDLTEEEWQAYRPGGGLDRADPVESAHAAEERRLEAWRVAREACRMLREEFGAYRIVVFGSLARGRWFTPWSDIDLAAWGIPPARFYAAVAAVTGLSADFRLDLVDLDGCRPVVREAVEREGVEL